MTLAGITVVDTSLVRDAIDLARSSSEPRSWLFGVLLSGGMDPAPDPDLLAVSIVLHDLGLTDGDAAKDRGISKQQIQLVWDTIALHTTRSIALHKEPEVAMTHSGITVDAIGVGLDRITKANHAPAACHEAGWIKTGHRRPLHRRWPTASPWRLIGETTCFNVQQQLARRRHERAKRIR
jgi:hypothetical protein